MRLMFRAIAILGLSLFPTMAVAQVPGIGSDAELWLQRSGSEKVAYLDGLCDAMSAANQQIGSQSCKPETEWLKELHGPSATMRFCGARWGYGGKPSGVQIIDKFYADKDHSDITVIYAMGLFNDKACGEHTVDMKRLIALQAFRKCSRQLVNMTDLASTAIAGQREECDRLQKALPVK